MPDEPKITFQLTAHEGEHLEVRLTAPGGEARGETVLPPKDALDELALADPARVPATLIEKVGEALYRSLVCEDVDELVVDTLNDAIRAAEPAQFELRFDADQVTLAGYPWEMIRNAQGQFLVRDGLVDLTRYISYPQPPPSFDASIRDLPIFRVISQPTSLPPITAIDLKFRPLETLPHATFEGFMRRLLIDRMALWGLQFDGHGALVAQCPKCNTLNGPDTLACWNCGESLKEARRIGALAFEANNAVNWVPTSEFGSVLYNAHVRLAMLLACETARVGNALVFSGLAPGLLLAGVPAVIGMQCPVRDDFANSFANEFYSALAKNGDLLAALRIARRMNMLGAWYSPALYLRRKPGDEEEQSRPVYLTRNIDTAAPAQVNPGVDFLARLWIRRPETRPLTVGQLRKELDIPQSVPVRQGKGEAEVKFEPVEGRTLRRGEVEVQMTSPSCTVKPEGRVKLFIDESLDAPPAIFTARAQATGRVPLIFSVYQDGGQIHSVVHHVDVTGTSPGFIGYDLGVGDVATHSQSVAIEGDEAGRSGMLNRRPSTQPAGPASPGSPLPPPPPPAIAAWLVADDGRSFELTSGQMHIGRSAENEIHLAGDQTVSRRHAMIVEQEGEYALQDLGSRGGTYVNGDEATTVVLQDGDVIQLGQHTRLQFRLEGARDVKPPSDMDETLARPPIKKVDTLPEEPDLDKEELLEELQDLKDIVEKIEPEPEASVPSGPPAGPKPPVPPTQVAPAEPEPAAPPKPEAPQQTPEEWQAEEKERRRAEAAQPRPLPPPPAQPPVGQGQVTIPHSDDQEWERQKAPSQTDYVDYGHQSKTQATPRPKTTGPRMWVGGCIAVVVVVGLLLLGVTILLNSCSGPEPGPGPNEVPVDGQQEQVEPSSDVTPPLIEGVEHFPGEVGYGEYCPEEQRQFTVQAHVLDDNGLVDVSLVYFFRTDQGEQVGSEVVVPMAQVEPGVYQVIVPTRVAQEAGFNAVYGEIVYTITAADASGNRSDSGEPRSILIHQCIG